MNMSCYFLHNMHVHTYAHIIMRADIGVNTQTVLSVNEYTPFEK